MKSFNDWISSLLILYFHIINISLNYLYLCSFLHQSANIDMRPAIPIATAAAWATPLSQ